MPYTFGQPWTPVYQDTRLAPIVRTTTAGFPSGGSITATKRSLTQRAADTISEKLTPVVGRRMAEKVGGLFDWTPAAAVTTGADAGADIRQGNYAKGGLEALGALLNVLPDGGAALGKGLGVSHSIIAPLFHGSPHKFEKFALEKIGTGEGAQAYGHGLYFAENKNVADQYRAALSGFDDPNASGYLYKAGG